MQTHNFQAIPINNNLSHHQQDEELLTSFLNHSFSHQKQNISKESTKEVMYEEIRKQISQAKNMRKQLTQQFQMKKDKLIYKALKQLISELQQLSKQNQLLREQQQIIIRSGNTKRTEYNQTPRNRKSINSIINENPKIVKPKQQIYEFNSSRKKSNNSQYPGNLRKSYQYQSRISEKPLTQIYDPTNNRCSMPMNKKFQMTEKKQNLYHSEVNNLSLTEVFACDQSEQYRSQQNYTNSKNPQHNIFLQLLNTIVQQQKLYEKDIIEQINIDTNYFESQLMQQNNQKQLIYTLQNKIQQTVQSINKLQKITKIYEDDIKTVNHELQAVIDTTTYIMNQKGHSIAKHHYLQNKRLIHKQLKEKQQKIRRISKSKQHNKNKDVIPQSLHLLMNMLGAKNSISTKNPKVCLQELQKLLIDPQKFRIDRTNRKNKTKQLIQSIKSGRNKFQQLNEIYQSRISKLQNKISVLSKEKLQ